MKRIIFICFLIVVSISVIVFCSTIQSNLKAEESKENKMMSKSTLERSLEEYKKLLEKFEKSNYVMVKGKVVKKSKQPLTPTEKKEIEIIKRALYAMKGRASPSEGDKVIIQSDEKQHVIIFGQKLPEGWLGSSSFKVIIDAKSGKLLKILWGSD